MDWDGSPAISNVSQEFLGRECLEKYLQPCELSSNVPVCSVKGSPLPSMPVNGHHDGLGDASAAPAG